ncbi:MAG: efflux RND transporter periplasmic adaptor subunit [Spirulinaceae cyanobacterium]
MTSPDSNPNSPQKPPIPPESQSNLGVAEHPAPETEISEVESDEQAETQERPWWQKYWWVLLIAVLGVAVAGVTIWRLRENNTPAEVTETAPLSVRTTEAQREAIQAWVSSEGTVRATEYKHLTFEYEGDVTYLAQTDGRRLREGDRVTEGQLLARIDDRQLIADVRQAEAAVSEARQQQAAAQANVAQTQTQVAQARSQVQEAIAQLQNAQSSRRLAATNVERYRALVNEGVVSELEFDQRQNSLEDARAQVQSAQARVESARQQVTAAQAQVTAAQQQLAARQSAIDTAQARLSQAQVALEGASLYAPFNGVVAYLNISEGEYFTPQAVSSQLGGDYQGILNRIPMVVIDPSQYEVLVDLASPAGEQVEVGQEAFIASETDLNAQLMPQDMSIETLIANARARGEVFAVNPAVSPGGRAIEARIRLNPATTESLRHGERVLTWIAVAENPDAVVVPLSAIARREQVPYVFVVDPESNTVEQREVELGITGITQQAVTEGLEAGEMVVTEGQNRLVDGASVQIVGENVNDQ